MKQLDTVQVLEHNVKELQCQLKSAQIRIAALNEELNKYKEKYRREVDKHFDFKMHQKSLTELNFDGNETRGRYGEDESL